MMSGLKDYGRLSQGISGRPHGIGSAFHLIEREGPGVTAGTFSLHVIFATAAGRGIYLVSWRNFCAGGWR
jgi:hypothetical protein